MTKKRYSHSKISTFEQCPYKFKLKYIDKIKPTVEKSIEAHLGSSVHSALEELYSQILKNKILELDEVLLHYTKEWQKEFSEEIAIPRQRTTAQDYFQKGVEFLINYYTSHAPFDDGTIELEKEIILPLTEEYEIWGFIDRLVFNKKTQEYEIHDYKTSNSLPDKEKIASDRQLALYSIAIKEILKLPKTANIKLIWHYLAHNKKIESFRTEENLENLKKEIIEIIKKIESTKEFPKCESMLCNWCEYKDICKGEKHRTQKQALEEKERKFDLRGFY